MRRILVTFHTSEGQTAKIADHVAAVLRDLRFDVEVHDVAGAPGPETFDGVIVGDSIHAGRHSRALTRYLQGHRAAFDARPTALFQVSLTSADPDAEHTATAQTLVHDLIERTGVEPDVVGLFAGALVYTQYGWFKRRLMHAIVRRDVGDTDTRRDYEYTDWASVERFASDVGALVRETGTAPVAVQALSE
jgi:menaquinone-dependent protoporphyrinogen oxidase